MCGGFILLQLEVMGRRELSESLSNGRVAEDDLDAQTAQKEIPR